MNLYKAETIISVLTYVVGENEEEARKVALKTWENGFDRSIAVNWNNNKYSVKKLTQVFVPDPGHNGIAFCNDPAGIYPLSSFKDPVVQEKIANIRDQIKSLEKQLHDLETE